MSSLYFRGGSATLSTVEISRFEVEGAFELRECHFRTWENLHLMYLHVCMLNEITLPNDDAKLSRAGFVG